MQETPKAVRALAIACALVLLAGIAAVLTKDDSESVTADDTATTTTTAGALGSDLGLTPRVPDTIAGGSTTIAGDPGASSTTTAPATTATTTAPVTTVPQGGGGSVQATAAGTYLYDTSGTLTLGANQRQLPPVTKLTVAAVDGQNRQVQVRDLRDENGDGSITRITYRYAAEGVYLERLEIESSFSGFGSNNVLTAKQPYLVVPASAGMGTQTTGRLEGDGITADITFTVGEITGEITNARLVAKLSGSITGTQTSDMKARTSDRLTTYEKVVSDVQSQGVAVKSNYEATLKN